MPSIDPLEDDVPASPPRFCIICGKRLSRYNQTDYCFHHPDPKKEKRREETRLLQQKALELAQKEEEAQHQMELVKLAKERDTALQPLIIATVCRLHSVTFNELEQHNRRHTLVRARHILMYLLYMDTSLSYPDIGKLLGGRDHTTVIHGVEKISNELDTDPALQAIIRQLRSNYQTPAAR